jgi:uncharacterized protein (TIGR02266 family)
MTDWDSIRRHRRVPFAFGVEIDGAVRTEAACQRIAAAGLYAYTPHVLAPGTDVKLSLVLPDSEMTRVAARGRVLQAQAEDPATGRLGGMKVLFLGLDANDEEAVRAFVRSCLERETEYSKVTAVSPEGRRVYSARFFGTETDSDSYVVDISEGGLYVRTLRLPAKGEEVYADLYLPGAGAVTRVEATVAWRREHDPNAPGQAGCGLTFGQVPDETRGRIQGFVERFGR